MFYPVLSRLFSPETFGQYALLNSFTSVAAVGSSLRYDLAIISADTNIEARALLSASLLFIAIIAMVSGLLMSAFITGDRMGLGVLPSLAGVLAFLMVALLGLSSAMRCWNVRQRRFEDLSRVSVRQSLARVAVACLGGLYPQWYCLTAADLIGRTYGITYMVRRNPVAMLSGDTAGTLREMKDAITKYWTFPALLLPSSLLDTLTVMLPVPLLAALYGSSAAGQFALSYQLLSVPSILLNASVAESFHSHLNECAAVGGQKALRLFWHTCAGLIAVGAVPFAVIFVGGRVIFPMLLGGAWVEAGLLSSAMAPWLFAMFVISPLERTVIVFRGQSLKLGYNATMLLVSFALIYYAGHTGRTLSDCVRVLSAVSFVMLVVYVVFLGRLVRTTTRRAFDPPGPAGCGLSS